MIVLDHINNIVLDPANPPLNNYQAFQHNYSGLKILADSVREIELQRHAANPPGSMTFHFGSSTPPIVPNAFAWYSVTLVNYLRLIALVELMITKSWTSQDIADPQNAPDVKKACTNFVKNAAPEIYTWRNKVSAHFALTDPFRDDNLGTLEHSIMDPVTYSSPYFYVGQTSWVTAGHQSQLPSWALTKNYEDLASRFWPEQTLKPFA